MIYIIALISILLGSFAQYFLKIGMLRMDLKDEFTTLLRNAIVNIPLWGGIFCYGLSLLFWLFVLSKMELSRAYPMVSLGYVFTLFLGYFLLNETLSIFKCIGIALIVTGVLFITRAN